MEKVKIGSTDVEASVITFGAWAIGGWMWGGADRKEAVKAIQSAYDAGMTSIDTAPIYGQGTSEEIVGEAIADIPRDQVQLLTKFGMRWDRVGGDFAMNSKDNSGKAIDIYKWCSKESIIEECEASLKRLKTDYIDLYQQHWPETVTPINEIMEAMEILLQQGKIRAAGVCNYNKVLMEEANKTLHLASNQVEYSMINRGIENELVPYCIKERQSIIAYSPLQRGLLTGKIKPGHHFGEGDTRSTNRFYTQDNILKVNEFLAAIQPLADSRGVKIGQLALAWALAQEGITVLLAGARNAEQALENAKATEIQLAPEELAHIRTKLEQYGL
jgi:aryl-alcohol dehydrogenase-like predicted oxidoreductase